MIVIGAGRIGTALHQLAPESITLLDRTGQVGRPGQVSRPGQVGRPGQVSRPGQVGRPGQDGWDVLADEPGRPIVVAVRNDDLDAVLERVPERRRPDLVFVQNGMLRPWLAEHGLSGATRGLLFIAVAKRGDPIQAGAASPFCGPRAAAVVATLTAHGVPAELVSAERFKAIELEKLIWNCAFGLCCEAFGATVGEVVEQRADELRAVVAELLAVGERLLGVELELDPLVERLSAYSRSIADFRGAVREWRWRNGAFVDAAEQLGMTMPMHARLLRATGHLGAGRAGVRLDR
jgi:ketopantoate reductase